MDVARASGVGFKPMRLSAVLQKNWQSLIKPEKIEVEPGSDPVRVATIIAEPLERGFGMTLGNAIRRVLMSSLQGAAVTAVQIDGVLHEFSSIPGVREDVTDIVLNIKQLALRMHGDGPKRMVLNATGPGEVRAGHIGVGQHARVGVRPAQLADDHTAMYAVIICLCAAERVLQCSVRE